MVFIALQTALTVGVTYLIWRICSNCRRRSSIDHIPGPKQTSLLLPGFSGFTSRDAWDFMDDIAQGYGSVVKLRDVFGRKMLYITDPKALHTALVAEHQSYEETPEFLVAGLMLFGPGILSSTGDAHRKKRRLLSSMFSIGNLRELTHTLTDIGETFRDVIATQVKDHKKDVDVLKWCSRVVLEMTGQSFLNYSFDPLVEETHNEYAAAIENAFSSTYAVPIHFFIALSWVRTFGVTKLGRWIADYYPLSSVQKAKNEWDTMWRHARELIEKKIAIASGQRGTPSHSEKSLDMFSLLVNANMSASDEDRLTNDELIAHANEIIFGAVETTSNTVSRMLHTLALHPDAQDKLRNEIKAACDADIELSYEQILELPFLDAVYRETLRAFPAAHTMNREAKDDTILPLWRPLKDLNGHVIHEVAIDKGTTIIIGIHGYNRSKAIWGTDANEWKPERWLSALPEPVRSVPSGGVFANTMTFIGGQRSCIGFKFAELVIKVIVIYLLQSLKFSPSKSEIVWNTSRIIFPTTDKENTESSLPLTVELVGV